MATAATRKWVRGMVPITGSNGTVRRPGWVLGNIGIARDDYDTPDGEASREGNWRVAHIPSGLGFCMPFDLKRHARGLAELIADLMPPDLLDRWAGGGEWAGKPAMKRATSEAEWRRIEAASKTIKEYIRTHQ